jgi:peptidyl-prolyl cis-trans isomerase C
MAPELTEQNVLNNGAVLLRAASTVAIAALALALAGCDGCNDHALQADAGDGGVTSSSQLTPEQSARVLAKVGDVTVTLGDYVAALEHMDQFDRLRYQSPERRKELLEDLIEVELLAREATAKGYDNDPVAQQELRATLRDALLHEAHEGATEPNAIPDEEVHAYFDAHKADYKDPERRRVSLIVLKDEATAKTVLDQALKTPGATQFGEIVRSKSTDAQARANVPVDLAGDFGMISPPGDDRGDNPRIPSEVRAGAFEIAKVDDVLPRVVKSGDKFYVVRLTQKTDARERTFAEAERSIRVKLAQDKLRLKEDDLMKQLRTQYPVQIDETVLATVKVNLDGGAAPAVDAATKD